METGDNSPKGINREQKILKKAGVNEQDADLARQAPRYDAEKPVGFKDVANVPGMGRNETPEE